MTTHNNSWSFPKDFMWGVASSAYQVEGAVADEGRAPSVWDVLVHRVGDWVTGNATGDVADNNYYLYKQGVLCACINRLKQDQESSDPAADIARLAALGIPYYSFSIAWPRIFPLGRGPTNPAGIAHYDDVIQTCLDYNITPVVTLFHWDLPVYLQNLYGGWLSPSIVNDFSDYARFVFKRWAAKVPIFLTINEPVPFCANYPWPAGYFRDLNGSVPAAQQQYFCGHNVLLAHASAYRIAKDELGLADTRITFKNNGGYKIPQSPSPADAQAVERAWAFNEGWFADPVFLTGDYPPALKQYVSGFLPDFTPAQRAAIKGSADFFAHDAYTSSFYFAPDGGVGACVANTSNALYPKCYNSSATYADADGGWAVGATADVGTPWLHKAADWIPALLAYIQATWKSEGGVAITEFGFSVPYEELRTLTPDVRADYLRAQYYVDYLEGMLIALSEGTNVRRLFFPYFPSLPPIPSLVHPPARGCAVRARNACT